MFRDIQIFIRKREKETTLCMIFIWNYSKKRFSRLTNLEQSFMFRWNIFQKKIWKEISLHWSIYHVTRLCFIFGKLKNWILLWECKCHSGAVWLKLASNWLCCFGDYQSPLTVPHQFLFLIFSIKRTHLAFLRDDLVLLLISHDTFNYVLYVEKFLKRNRLVSQ